MCHTPIISCGVTLRTCLFSPCVAVFSYRMYMMLRLYLLYEHIYEFMQAAADSQVDIIPLVAVVSTTHHGATQPHPPEPFNFRGLDN